MHYLTWEDLLSEYNSFTAILEDGLTEAEKASLNEYEFELMQYKGISDALECELLMLERCKLLAKRDCMDSVNDEWLSYRQKQEDALKLAGAIKRPLDDFFENEDECPSEDFPTIGQELDLLIMEAESLLDVESRKSEEIEMQRLDRIREAYEYDCNPENGEPRTFYANRDLILKELGYKDYPDYLHSKLWATIREHELKKWHNKCFACKAEATQLHHTFYTRAIMLGTITFGLLPMCAYCHKACEYNHTNKTKLTPLKATFKAILRRKYGKWLQLREDLNDSDLKRIEATVKGACRILTQYRGY